MKLYATLLAAILLNFHVIPVVAGMDDARLKEWLKSGLFELLLWRDFDIKASGVTDEQFYRVLMELYREAEDKWPTLTPDTDAWRHNLLVVEGVLGCLPMCGEWADKTFLMDVAADTSKDVFLRTIAIGSFLRSADAKEARYALVRFLIEEGRLDSQARSSILEHAHTAYQEAGSGKKRAILESLYVSLANEDSKWLFRVYDRILSRLSQQYANSEQRRYILKRLIYAKPTCKADEYAMVGLENMLRELDKTNLYTTINTNLSVLKERDFNQPLSEDERIAIKVPSDAPDAGGTAHEDTPRTRRNSLYALGGAAAVILAASALWLGFRSRRGTV